MKQPNKLITETSPYLLQHAHNPVNWYPWGGEAIAKAKEEDKPVLVSIGYAACHWCHVMERESFENEPVAAFMNEHFINIKIDREERPDLDHIYMDAVQAMTGSGGWPLNVFLTPGLKPFYGGTYFPPEPAYNRASWPDVLAGVAKAFRERRHEIESQAENLTLHLEQANDFGLKQPGSGAGIFTAGQMETAFSAIMKTADREWGGFGQAPKFPQVFATRFLLRYSHLFSSPEAKGQALLSIDKMIQGGIYDQLGGGFARYSTDAQWLAPHFEKMLYDNALLTELLAEAFQLTGNIRYKEVIAETIEFALRELYHPSGGFYAALDADSEGEEGRYYVWDYEEVKALLGDDAELLAGYYDITPGGNWEGKNILRVKVPLPDFAAERGLKPEELEAKLSGAKDKLLQAREKRERPLLDDKVILSWNALMCTACCKAFAATGVEQYRQLAVKNIRFLLREMTIGSGPALCHTWKNGEGKYPAFLDDYAFLVRALIHTYEITADTTWLDKAKEVTEWVLPEFDAGAGGFFFYTPQNQPDIIVRKKEVYDGAQPSGNAVMAENLLHLGILFDKKEWKERSMAMITSLGTAILRYPASFGYWAVLSLGLTKGFSEITITGGEFRKIQEELLKRFLPYCIIMASPVADEGYPLLAGKHAEKKTKIFLCKDYSCQQPVDTVEELMWLINRGDGQ